MNNKYAYYLPYASYDDDDDDDDDDDNVYLCPI